MFKKSKTSQAKYYNELLWKQKRMKIEIFG